MTSGLSDSDPGGGSPVKLAFKWICPYCRESRISRYTEGEGEEKAVEGLRSHVIDANGEGHGPRHELPADRERILLDYVCCVDGIQ